MKKWVHVGAEETRDSSTLSREQEVYQVPKVFIREMWSMQMPLSIAAADNDYFRNVDLCVSAQRAKARTKTKFISGQNIMVSGQNIRVSGQNVWVYGQNRRG